jgi:hypothetical protein
VHKAHPCSPFTSPSPPCVQLLPLRERAPSRRGRREGPTDQDADVAGTDNRFAVAIFSRALAPEKTSAGFLKMSRLAVLI